MTIDELRELCQEAARDLVARGGSPVPAAVVLPAATQTRVTVLEDFPDDDDDRHLVLSHFAADHMVPSGAPCFGFIAEAELVDGATTHDVVVVAFGARQRGTWITAATLDDAQLGPFSAAEQLDAAALPFLRPLQHAVDMATAADGGDDVLGLS